MSDPKDPRLNGWKYLAFNYTDKEHKELTDMLDELCLMTGIHKKKIVMLLVKQRLEELKSK